MVYCERCGSRFHSERAAQLDYCPSCLLRDDQVVTLRAVTGNRRRSSLLGDSRQTTDSRADARTHAICRARPGARRLPPDGRLPRRLGDVASGRGRVGLGAHLAGLPGRMSSRNWAGHPNGLHLRSLDARLLCKPL